MIAAAAIVWLIKEREVGIKIQVCFLVFKQLSKMPRIALKNLANVWEVHTGQITDDDYCLLFYLLFIFGSNENFFSPGNSN
jgi:hypothetical protein